MTSAAATYYDRLKAFIRKRVSSAEEAEDIVQEVFYQYARLDEVLNPIENVAAWLYRVARNRIVDTRRKKREEQLPSWTSEEGEVLGALGELLAGDGTTPEDDYMKTLVWERLEEALSELPVPQREVFEQTEMQGKSIREIEAETGVGQATLLSRKHYAVLHLRERMEDLYEEMLVVG